MRACVEAGVPVQVVPGVTSAVAAPAAANVPVTHRGVAQHCHIVSAHVPPGDPRSTVDWSALARSSGTLVLLMGLRQLGDVVTALVRYGRPAETPVRVVQDATLPTQRVVTATLATVSDEVQRHDLRPPTTTVIGDVVDVARGIEAALASRPGRWQKGDA